MLYRMKLNKTIEPSPTVGHNAESITFNNIEFNCWDINSNRKVRSLWFHYYAGTHAVIFVIDANDLERIQEAKDVLFEVMGHELLKDAALLVMANKMDLPDCMSVDQIIEFLSLKDQLPNTKWHVQAAEAITGRGLYEGFQWLCIALTSNDKTP
eukprot:CAMPEP_0182427542 /NCGR_PEP_ID=MMETSP1167-20130531/18258_1 /TAXON_ID=2988 /ORGANISM="Mallomonas Sp, Strain CCMP3275" /LENGTH=153 /DNA_ID=CAMNT_0024609851 /DNA_START=296 /DNA_END=757 /DNA_ORIENTATION=+